MTSVLFCSLSATTSEMCAETEAVTTVALAFTLPVLKTVTTSIAKKS